MSRQERGITPSMPEARAILAEGMISGWADEHKACSTTVIPGHADGSPHLRLIVWTQPEGDGDVLADVAYGHQQL